MIRDLTPFSVTPFSAYSFECKDRKDRGQVYNKESLFLRRVTQLSFVVLSDFLMAVCTCFIGNNDLYSPAFVLRCNPLAGLCDKVHSEILIGVVLS